MNTVLERNIRFEYTGDYIAAVVNAITGILLIYRIVRTIASDHYKQDIYRKMVGLGLGLLILNALYVIYAYMDHSVLLMMIKYWFAGTIIAALMLFQLDTLGKLKGLGSTLSSKHIYLMKIGVFFLYAGGTFGIYLAPFTYSSWLETASLHINLDNRLWRIWIGGSVCGIRNRTFRLPFHLAPELFENKKNTGPNNRQCGKCRARA
jgi:hypothetical protein